jgi:hypothetical protein
MPIVSLALAALLLLGMYNGLLQTREENREAELQAKMETLLPGSTTFTEEAYTGDDANIVCVYKGETGFVVGTTTQGYAGPISMLIGVHSDGYAHCNDNDWLDIAVHADQCRSDPLLGYRNKEVTYEGCAYDQVAQFCILN